MEHPAYCRAEADTAGLMGSLLTYKWCSAITRLCAWIVPVVCWRTEHKGSSMLEMPGRHLSICMMRPLRNLREFLL